MDHQKEPAKDGAGKVPAPPKAAAKTAEKALEKSTHSASATAPAKAGKSAPAKAAKPAHTAGQATAHASAHPGAHPAAHPAARPAANPAAPAKSAAKGAAPKTDAKPAGKAAPTAPVVDAKGKKGKEAPLQPGKPPFEEDPTDVDADLEADGEVEGDVEVEAVEETSEVKVKAKPLRMKVSRAKERALMREFGLDETQLTEEEVAKRRQELKTLIKMGKTRGYLTHQEINDHLPEKLVDNEILEAIVSMLNDMGIAVYEQAPDAATLLISGSAQATATEEEAEEAAEAALSTVDSEFGRTTDPVRMYMREMGSVELLTREGEIEIAKR
ncbi:MAG TPA: RNA polymerase sigma factor region1.1 domain-containing protein, partial [Burkholderiaceae bacterium]|nr:RNA polymerase sigma factor region1.1 domain-containing protein [Burkholderiaceae bacterium]